MDKNKLINRLTRVLVIESLIILLLLLLFLFPSGMRAPLYLEGLYLISVLVGIGKV